MKTVSNYLFELYKPCLQQLEGVAEASIDIALSEYPIFLTSGSVMTISDLPTLIIRAIFYSNTDWEGQVLPDVGSLKFKSCSRNEFPTTPRELEVSLSAKPGKETQAILDILKDNFNDSANSQ